MNNTVLQIPINKGLRDQASSKVERMGFSSLQEVVRLFLSKIASGEMDIKFQENIQLSAKVVKRYNKVIDEVQSGKDKTKTFVDVDLLMKHLNED